MQQLARKGLGYFHTLSIINSESLSDRKEDRRKNLEIVTISTGYTHWQFGKRRK